MTEHSVTLPVPDDIYNRAAHIAQLTAQPVEAVLLQQLRDAFADPLAAFAPEEQQELTALALLSDETLWTIAREQMTAEKQTRLQTLMDGNTQGTLDARQRAELEALVGQGQQLTMRKGKAAALLTDRGYAITIDALSPPHE